MLFSGTNYVKCIFIFIACKTVQCELMADKNYMQKSMLKHTQYVCLALGKIIFELKVKTVTWDGNIFMVYFKLDCN